MTTQGDDRLLRGRPALAHHHLKGPSDMTDIDDITITAEIPLDASLDATGIPGAVVVPHISPGARVYDSASVSGSARVYGSARVSGSARVYGSARVSGSAAVSGSARVYGDAVVSGSAVVHGQGDIASTRHVLTVGPVGSEDRTVTIHRHYDGPDSTRWGHLVVAGCWAGTLDELAERISPDGAHGWDGGAERWRADYGAVIAMARVRVAEWEAEPLTAADHERWKA